MKIIKYFLVIFIIISFTLKAQAANPGDVVINEIAWMGTKAKSGGEWIELYNKSGSTINVTNWTLEDSDEVIATFSGSRLNNSTISIGGYYLIEWHSSSSTDTSIRDIVGDFQGLSWSKLGNNPDGDILILKDETGTIIDSVDCLGGWFAGEASPNYITMERILPSGDSNSRDNWADNDLEIMNGHDTDGNPIRGTPRQKNSASFIAEVDIGDKLMEVTDSPFFPHKDNPNQPVRGTITYKVEPNSFLTLTIYNINGYVIKYLKRNILVGAVDAQGVAFWAGKDDFDSMVPVGIYIVHLRAEHRDTGKVKTEQATIVVGRKF